MNYTVELCTLWRRLIQAMAALSNNIFIYFAPDDFQTEILLTPRFSNQNTSFSSVKEYSIEEYCNILCILVGN